MLISSSAFADTVENAFASVIAEALREPMSKLGANDDKAIKAASMQVVKLPAFEESLGIAKKKKKKYERAMYEYMVDVTGLSKAQLGTIAGVSVSLSRGEVSTKSIKYRIRLMKNKKLIIRPDVIYNFKHREVASAVTLNWTW